MLTISTRRGANAPGLPAPTPLPPLRDALRRRAALFGPVEVDEPRVAPRRLPAHLADLMLPLRDAGWPDLHAPSSLSAPAHTDLAQANRRG